MTVGAAGQGLVFAPMPTHGGFMDLTGQRFGRLAITGYAGRNRHGAHMWSARCDCGAAVPAVHRGALRNGRTKSCGCLSREAAGERVATHRLSKHPLYLTWKNITQRCENPRNPNYKHYGGRGIQVCARWRNSFPDFLAGMGDAPFPGASLDRFPDQNGNYEPGNVRWATPTEQMRNTTSNRVLEYNGESMCMSAWAERLGIPYFTLHYRFRLGWSVERALTQPVRKLRPRVVSSGHGT